MAKAKKLMRILGGYITHLSLCAAGANNIQTIYKSEDGTDENVTFTSASKTMNELGEIYSVIYSPEVFDLQGDIASFEVIKQLAYSFSKAGKGIDIMHNEKVMPKDAIYVAESFILSTDVNKLDSRFEGMLDNDGQPVDVTGGWGVVMKVEDENLKNLYRSGEWQGISMGGVTAKRPEKVTLVKAVKRDDSSIVEDSKMTKEEMMAILAESNKGLVTTLVPAMVEGITKVLKPKEPETSDEQKAKKAAVAEFMKSYPTPVLPGNPSDDQLALMEKAIVIHDLAKSVDPTQPTQVLEFHQNRKAILEGKEIKIQKSFGVDPWGFQRTNQSGTGNNTNEIVTAKADMINPNCSADQQLSDIEVDTILKMIPTYDEGKIKKEKVA